MVFHSVLWYDKTSSHQIPQRNISALCNDIPEDLPFPWLHFVSFNIHSSTEKMEKTVVLFLV